MNFVVRPTTKLNDSVMTVDELVQVFYGRLWNQIELSVADKILHPEVVFRGSVGVGASGPTGICDYVRMVTTALSDYRCDVETLVVDGSNAAARVRFSGVHRGEFLGYAPTGRRVEWIGAAFFVEEDGVLRDIWVLGDLTSLRAQLAS
jgi:predicted ester cyclase